MNELDRLNSSLLELNNRLDRNYHEYQAELSKIKIDLAMLQVKSSLWGAGAAILVTIGAVLVRYVGGH